MLNVAIFISRTAAARFPLALVYDYEALSELVRSSPELATELKEIVRHTSSYRQTGPRYVDAAIMRWQRLTGREAHSGNGKPSLLSAKATNRLKLL
jgi:hypothetical protein